MPAFQAFTAPLPVLPAVANPRFLACSDLDETYLAHVVSAESSRARQQAEQVLAQLAQEKSLLFGWVTGSVISNVLEKVKQYQFGLMPHFIASSLGTELYLWSEAKKQYVADSEWFQSANFTSFQIENIEKILQEVEQRLDLKVPHQIKKIQQSLYKRSYYLPRQFDRVTRVVAVIQQVANEYHMEAFITPCNPMAGDPDNHFDIDFVPQGCGKAQAVKFLTKRYHIPISNVFAFGDSGNDMAMLAFAGHGFLVKNAMPELNHPQVQRSQKPYAEAIAFELTRFFQGKCDV